MIEIMLVYVTLMSYARAVIVVLFLWGVGPILTNGCGIQGHKVCCIASQLGDTRGI